MFSFAKGDKYRPILQLLHTSQKGHALLERTDCIMINTHESPADTVQMCQKTDAHAQTQCGWVYSICLPTHTLSSATSITVYDLLVFDLSYINKDI